MTRSIARLLREASSLRAPIPQRPPWSQDFPENENWNYSSIFGQYYLSSFGVATLRDNLRMERVARRSERNHWMAWIGAFTGLVGALTRPGGTAQEVSVSIRTVGKATLSFEPLLRLNE